MKGKICLSEASYFPFSGDSGNSALFLPPFPPSPWLRRGGIKGGVVRKKKEGSTPTGSIYYLFAQSTNISPLQGEACPAGNASPDESGHHKLCEHSFLNQKHETFNISAFSLHPVAGGSYFIQFQPSAFIPPQTDHTSYNFSLQPSSRRRRIILHTISAFSPQP